MATCSETLATGCSGLHATHPQQICICCEYSQQVRSGRLATTCCHNMLPELNVSQLWQHVADVVRVLRVAAQVYVAGDWQHVCGLLWETCCQCCECRPKATLCNKRICMLILAPEHGSHSHSLPYSAYCAQNSCIVTLHLMMVLPVKQIQQQTDGTNFFTSTTDAGSKCYLNANIST